MSECQIAIIGCGGIAEAYAKALQRMPNARLTAVVDPDASALATRRSVTRVPRPAHSNSQ